MVSYVCPFSNHHATWSLTLAFLFCPLDDNFKKNYTKAECAEMAQHMLHESALPKQCAKYDDVVVDLRRRDSDTTHPTQFLG